MRSTYVALYGFDSFMHIFFCAAVLFMLLLQMAYVRRTGHLRQLRWLVPACITGVLALIYRLVAFAMLFFRARYPYAAAYASIIWVDTAEAVELIGFVIQTKMILAGQVFGNLTGQYYGVGEIWPPPPSE